MSLDIEMSVIADRGEKDRKVENVWHIHKCRCNERERHPYCEEMCVKEHLVCAYGHYWSHCAETLYLSNDYYYSIAAQSQDHKQIALDVFRTGFDNFYYSSKEGATILNRLLNRLSNFTKELGYVQGMNYIASALLWHNSEPQAFWLFYKLLKAYDLQANFTQGFPGVVFHFSQLEKYIQEFLPDIYGYLNHYGISIPMFSADWCICLFCKVIPLEQTGIFFTFFVEEGWNYFYRVAVEVLRMLKKRIFKEKERFRIFNVIKPVVGMTDEKFTFLAGVQNSYSAKMWRKILIRAKNRQYKI